jgi:hypothetical protein
LPGDPKAPYGGLGPPIRNQNPGQSGPDPGPESVPGQGWPDPDSCFFFFFEFSFNLMPLNHEKERCRAKAKAKANKKAIRTSFFFGLDVFFWCGLSFSIQFGHFSFPSLAKGS